MNNIIRILKNKVIVIVQLIIIGILIFLLKKYPQYKIPLISLIVIVAILIFFKFFCICISRSTSKKKLDRSYDFNENELFEKYKNIGKKGCSIKNYNLWKDETLTEWNNQLEKTNRENFIRFLKRKCRSYRNSKEAILYIGIPVIIVEITVLSNGYNNIQCSWAKDIYVVIAGFITTIVFLSELYQVNDKISFLEDCIEIISKKETE